MYSIVSYTEHKTEENFDSYLEWLKKDEFQYTVEENYIDRQRHLIRVLRFRNGEEWLFPPLKMYGMNLDSVQPGDQIQKSAGSFEFTLLKEDGREVNGELNW